jgi:RimJ/RimL family protein N-acetyltransferase
MDDATLITPRLRLRLLDALDPTHAALYRRLYTCPKAMTWIGPPLPSREADKAFAIVCRHNVLRAPGHRFWSVEGRHSENAMGLVALRRRGCRAEFGVMVEAHAWRQGVAREALGALVPYAFERMGLETIDVRRSDDEQGVVMHRLVTRVGFEPVNPPEPGMRAWVLQRRQWTPQRQTALGFATSRR